MGFASMDAQFNVRTLRFESKPPENPLFEGDAGQPALPRGDRE